MIFEAQVFAIVVAGVLGLVIGSFLNVVIGRVPAGIPLTRESRCPACDAPIRWYQNIPIVSWIALRARCASCREPISVRYPLVELATGLAFAGVTAASVGSPAFAASVPASIAPWFVLAAYLYFVAISIALTLIDLDTHRLPNAIVLPGYIVTLVLLGTAAVLSGDYAALLRAAIGGAALWAFYFVIRLVAPRGMGGGDVKLAGLVGAYSAWIGWGALAVAAFGAFVVGGVVGIALIALRRATRRTAIPFGPWMIVGAWIGITSGEQIGRAYLGLTLAM
ncbi:A24 family peptidase [uncultured Microbacterium sp.]|uniref:prepilin peptidase n=1 Tax=uncultured Microbacterium sp. TaxID=191216 RepID=UPI0025D8471A|nr:A24 family peptidase [uncultured Microbacterium sp.]